ncbi:MAG: hypothetical protein CL535_08400 [Ahrensia sp.]|nr:hypothetical protein [Ahrensia sp.]MAZ16340.1 hypothetical protein [Ahrensia sp.]
MAITGQHTNSLDDFIDRTIQNDFTTVKAAEERIEKIFGAARANALRDDAEPGQRFPEDSDDVQ